MAGRALVSLSAWECEAAQRRQARPVEAQEPNSGIAKGGVLCMLRLHRCASLRQMLRVRARTRGGRSERAARYHLRLFVG